MGRELFCWSEQYMKIIQRLIGISIVLMLSACSENDNDNSTQADITPADINFTGVWSYEAVQDTYITSTDEKVYTEHRSVLVVMNDLPVGVRHHQCVLDEASGNYGVAIKTDQNFYFEDFENGFKALDVTTLSRERIYDLTYIDNRRVRETATLRKVSDVARANQGTVTLTGGGFLDENTDEVCITRWHHPSDIEGVINVTIPFEGSLLNIRMDYNNGMATGTYAQTSGFNDVVDLSLDTYGWFDAINTNAIFPVSGTLTISTYDEQSMAGDFSFTTEDQSSYTGTFNVNF